MNRKLTSVLLAGVLTVLPLAGCGGAAADGIGQASGALAFDNTAWNYSADDGVYWQAGVQYCESPASADNETLDIYVPAAYMTAVDNGDGTYTCELSSDGAVNGYTAATAPVVMPVNTPGYAAQSAPADYTSGLAEYLDAGFIYVIAGCRGRTAAAMVGQADAVPVGDGEQAADSRLPAGGDKTTGGKAPSDGSKTSDGNRPTGGTAPADGAAPADGRTSSGGTAPTDGGTPPSGEAPADGGTSSGGTAPTDGGTPPGGEAPASGETPPSGAGPGAGGTPPGGEAPTDGAAPPSGEGGPQSEASDGASATAASAFIASFAVPLAAGGFSSAAESAATSSPGKNGGTDDSVTGSAPWGVTDLKAAVRYLRYNAAFLPGNEERIFTFGMGGGGAQSALMGVTGDSELYTPYLEEIGAAMTDADGNSLSDAVFGSMCWYPTTSLDYADEAYEWSIGQYEDSGTRADGLVTSALSNDLAAAYAAHINALNLTGEDGAALTLEQSKDGIYAAGTYYDYLMDVIETALNNFLADTQFPYTPDNSTQAGFAGSAGGDGGASRENTETASYAAAEDYIAALNADGVWITYDAASNTASITSMADFVSVCKDSAKGVCAFDALDRSADENELFGSDENDGLHFDSALAALLADNGSEYAAYSDWDTSYPSSYEKDLEYVDDLGTSVVQRVNMYNPMYYLSDYYEGYGTSIVAPNFRIRTGLFQGDTALTAEANLALLLSQNEGVDVDYETVWGTSECSGDATENLIAWVQECMA